MSPSIPPPPEPPSTPPGSLVRVGLLHLDDSETVRTRLRRAVAVRGYLLESLASAAALRLRLAAAPVLAVVLDMDLGDGATGVDAARSVLASHPEAQIAFLTSDPAPELAAEAAVLGPVFDKTTGVQRLIEWLVALGEASTAAGRAG